MHGALYASSLRPFCKQWREMRSQLKQACQAYQNARGAYKEYSRKAIGCTVACQPSVAGFGHSHHCCHHSEDLVNEPARPIDANPPYTIKQQADPLTDSELAITGQDPRTLIRPQGPAALPPAGICCISSLCFAPHGPARPHKALFLSLSPILNPLSSAVT